ncbi:hypothetical protein BTO04_13085 [Polaribacter sp. SA4-10]|nr:hypothetical protein BTO04_13085 [Polaribacter sp. SA4-10]
MLFLKQSINLDYRLQLQITAKPGLTKYLEDDLVVLVLEHASYSAMHSLNKKIKNIVAENFGI